ncbi:hypothetical protein K469DRAFT_577661 [Zopfia rhizophila CBS 207.26]|uniref:Uncharacterized protein n=1 Tax=Zopfia rhizophila CBS 207.26 TaxID=1314779 RepID=A0A6A6E473_9PEZI|nr:hypothetical protein K469DRAFT_577661 [Zopfia rhizophila CBS 207.26]
MAAAALALADRHIASNILRQLSDMKYKVRRQFGPDQPVEFLEFRPTLVPSILVNRLWADEGTSILWARYPHLSTMEIMEPPRRQYYANKVERIFSTSPPIGHPASFDHLVGLQWPRLKYLELEVDFLRHGVPFRSMLHAGLEHLELSGYQSGSPEYFTETLLPALFTPCQNLKSIRFGPGVISEDDSLHSSVLYSYLDSIPSIANVEVKSAQFLHKDTLFTRLSQRAGLEGLEIDLEPGLQLLPSFEGPNAFPTLFSSLKRLTIMCYPEVAMAFPTRLDLFEELQLDVCRIPNEPSKDSDYTIFDDLLARLYHCPHLRVLRVGVGALAIDFPSDTAFPKLCGAALVNLALNCPKLIDINLFAIEPSAIDGSGILPAVFDLFCKQLPYLKNFSLKLHPPTATALETSVLQSLGNHCHDLEVLRLKIPFQLPSLAVPATVPDIMLDGEGTPTPKDETTAEDVSAAYAAQADINTASDTSSQDSAESSDIEPLFPRLTHLALCRPENVLAIADDSFTTSSSSHDGTISDIVDSDLEADLVRSWAHPLLVHFPSLEVLEAWGDWTGQDNESLNYFLPTEEILASTWEFLRGAEQDLWDVDEDEESWETYENGEDWDNSPYKDDFVGVEDTVPGLRHFQDEPVPQVFVNDFEGTEDSIPGLRNIKREPEGQITSGRTLEKAGYFEHSDTRIESASLPSATPVESRISGNTTSRVPTDEICNLRI